jgi:hypothetical protein
LPNIEDVVVGCAPNVSFFGAASAAPLSDVGGGAAGVVDVPAPNPKVAGGFWAGVVDAPPPKAPPDPLPPAAPKALAPEVFCAPVPLILSGFFPNPNPVVVGVVPEPKTVPAEAPEVPEPKTEKVGAPEVPNRAFAGGLEVVVAFVVPNGLLLPVAGGCDPNIPPPPLVDGGPKLKDMVATVDVMRVDGNVGRLAGQC